MARPFPILWYTWQCQEARSRCEHTERAWHYWLSRRSHKGPINWPKCVESFRKKLPLPKPRIMHHI